MLKRALILGGCLAGLITQVAYAGEPLQVLYDQTSGFTGFGITTATYITPKYLAPYDSEGANDFVVDNIWGWRVTGVKFVSFGGNSPATPPPGRARVSIYADTGSGPATNPVCPTTDGAVQFDALTNLALIELDAPCTVVEARHWVTVSFVTDRDNNGDDPNLAGAWGVVTGTAGEPALWRNPPGGTPTNCQSWRTLAECGRDQHGTEFGFQVIGIPNDSTTPVAPAIEPTVAPPIVPAGGASTLTLTLSNGNELPASLLSDMVNLLPTGLVVAEPSNVQTTCPSGVPLAAAGTDSVRLNAGAQIPPDGTCTLSVSVTAASSGRYVHTVPINILETDVGNNIVATSTELGVYGVADGGEIDLEVTLSTDPPPACGSTTSLDIPAGEPINFCFTMTNRTTETLNYHTLAFQPLSAIYTAGSDTHFFNLLERNVAPGESFQYNQVIVANAKQMPTFTWTAHRGLPTYLADETTPVSYIDITAIGSPLGLVAASAYQMALPFSFTLYDFTYNAGGDFELCLYNSGALHFVKHGCSPFGGLYHDNSRVGGIGPEDNGVLLPFWDYLGDAGEVYYATIGTAPNRQFVVEWNEKNHYSQPSASDGATFELILDEATGTISYLYKDTDFGFPGLDAGASATVGMNSYTHEFRQEYSYNEPVLLGGDRIVWRPLHVARTDSAQTRINVGAPRIAVTPASVQVSSLAGASVFRQLNINNLGDIALTWSIDEVAPTAHFPLRPASLEDDAIVRLDHPSRPEAQQPRPYVISGSASAFDVPAYAVKIEAAPSQNDNFVVMDASDPRQFATLPNLGLPLGGPTPRVGDFVGDDFSRLYMLMEDPLDGTLHHLITVDTATGISELIAANVAPLAPETQWGGASWDRISGKIYAVAWTDSDLAVCSTPDQSSALYSIDPSSGAVTRVGEIQYPDPFPICVSDIAVAPNGLIYGIDVYNDVLWAIDKTTGQTEVIGWVGFDLVEKNTIDFDDEAGLLYLAAYQQGQDITGYGGMHILNLQTGMAQKIASFPTINPDSDWLGLLALSVAKPGSNCVFPGDVPWLSFNVSSGTTAAGEGSTVVVAFDAESLTPGTYSADICVNSNDRGKPMTSVPVLFDVLDPDPVFSDGFDSFP